MRPEKNPLDLNNLPDDYTRDGNKQVFDESSSYGYRKKKSGAKDRKDECDKVYECRFCSLKFCKSQALGGHMNRHRQERETETLNRARQLVFGGDNLAAQAPHHLGCHPMAPGSYHPGGAPGNNIGVGGDPFRSSMYPPPPRLFSTPSSSSTLLPQPQSPYLYTSPSRHNHNHQLSPYPNSQYPPHNDYYIGHVLNNNNNNTTTPSSQTYQRHVNMNYQESSAYTCIGAPVGHGGFGPSSSRGSEGTRRDGSLSNNQEGFGSAQQQRLDPPPPSAINRF